MDSFKFNPYDPCVTNNIIEGETLTILLHVNDVKLSHKDTEVVYSFEKCIECMYLEPNIVKVKSVRVKSHEYFSMILDHTTKGEVKFDMQSM